MTMVAPYVGAWIEIWKHTGRKSRRGWSPLT